jgi:hypothetical protein
MIKFGSVDAKIVNKVNMADGGPGQDVCPKIVIQMGMALNLQSTD